MKRKFLTLCTAVGLMATGVYAEVATQTNVTRLYIATFDRTPDIAGLNYWVGSSNLSLESIAQSFFDQEETKAKYPEGTTSTDFIDAIYTNLFQRSPDSAGSDYWVGELDSGSVSNSVFILAVVNGAIGDDATILQSKTQEALSELGIGQSSYTIVDTSQENCFTSKGLSTECASSGQDGAYSTNSMSYTDNGDLTVTDNVTGLMWQQTADRDGNGEVKAVDKLSQSDAISYCSNLSLAGYSDWRLPDIKTIYSLMNFSGSDPSGETGDDTSSLEPFIDNTVFGFGYGDTDAGERIIDGQWATTTNYVSTTMNGDATMFGLNFADGRIKGYGLELRGIDKMFYVQCVRDNENYATNSFVDNGDMTITDSATELMWHKNDNSTETNWDSAISYCENSTLAGYSDWKLPDAKELQSIVDYTRSPDTTASPAINAIFNATAITNEAGVSDFGFYWSSTTHKSSNGTGASAVYVSFGRSLGYMDSTWMDAHGAGAQRSDPKDISLLDTSSEDYVIVDGAITHGPQGDVIRGLNFSRCVREVE